MGEKNRRKSTKNVVMRRAQPVLKGPDIWADLREQTVYDSWETLTTVCKASDGSKPRLFYTCDFIDVGNLTLDHMVGYLKSISKGNFNNVVIRIKPNRMRVYSSNRPCLLTIVASFAFPIEVAGPQVCSSIFRNVASHDLENDNDEADALFGFDGWPRPIFTRPDTPSWTFN